MITSDNKSGLTPSLRHAPKGRDAHHARRSAGSANGNGNGNGNANANAHRSATIPASPPGKSAFAKLATIMFVILLADLMFIWNSINNIAGLDAQGGGTSGAESGLHNLREKTGMEHLLRGRRAEKIRSLGGGGGDGPDEEKTGRKTSGGQKQQQQQQQQHRPQQIEAAADSQTVESSNTRPAEVDGRIKKILDSAGVKIDAELAPQLPKWDDVTSQYGPSPVIYGLETCEPYRRAVRPEDRLLGPAGIFNTGTNLLYELVNANCKVEAAKKVKRQRKGNGMHWQAPWGKHNPPSSHRLKNVAQMWGTGINQTDFFPVVMIKDPYHWMGSECRHKYSTFWDHSGDHCPNVVKWNVLERSEPSETRVKYALNSVNYDSLVDVWNKWYAEYDEQIFPMLHIRFEDLLFHGEEVIKTACECVGGVMSEKFVYIESSAKENGMPIHFGGYGLVKALLQYGNPDKRLNGFTNRDRLYANRFVRSDLMQKYGYSAPPLPT